MLSAPVRERRGTPRPGASLDEGLKRLSGQAFLTAIDAAYNTADFLTSGSMWAYRTIKDCEKELDRIELEIDNVLPRALVHVGESRAREMLACHRAVTELERVCDLLWRIADRLRGPARLSAEDLAPLSSMAAILDRMLRKTYDAFQQRSVEQAASAIRDDREMDRTRSAVLDQYLSPRSRRPKQVQLTIVLVTQGLERCGDHVTNVAEEILRMVEGESHRHTRKRETHA